MTWYDYEGSTIVYLKYHEGSLVGEGRIGAAEPLEGDEVSEVKWLQSLRWKEGTHGLLSHFGTLPEAGRSAYQTLPIFNDLLDLLYLYNPPNAVCSITIIPTLEKEAVESDCNSDEARQGVSRWNGPFAK